MVKNTRVEKVGNPTKAVASFYVKPDRISTPLPRCGKLLWKNLWRMWKTIGFQQVFRLSVQELPLWINLHNGLHNIGYKAVTTMLRYRRPTVPSTRKSPKLFASLEKMLSKTAAPSSCA